MAFLSRSRGLQVRVTMGPPLAWSSSVGDSPSSWTHLQFTLTQLQNFTVALPDSPPLDGNVAVEKEDSQLVAPWNFVIL